MDPVTSTQMVNALFQNTGHLIQDSFPLLFLFFGVFMAFFALGMFTRALRGGIRGAGGLKR